MVFHKSLSVCKSPQVSKSLFNILADLSNAVVWMVSTRSLISMPIIPFSKPLMIFPSGSITSGITVTLIFHSFFLVLKQGLCTYLCFTPSLSFLPVSPWPGVIVGLYIIITIIIYSFRVIHHSISRWFFTGVWETANLKSPGFFSVFWPSSIMLSFGLSPLVRQLPSPPGPSIILLLLYQKHQSQLV